MLSHIPTKHNKLINIFFYNVDINHDMSSQRDPQFNKWKLTFPALQIIT